MTVQCCIWFPNWPIQRLESSQPALKGQAIALFARGARGKRVVASSVAAQRLGITPGLTLAEAKGIAPRCQFEAHAPEADRETLRQLAWDCQRWSPQVGLDESEQPDCLLLDLSGCIHLLGSEENYRQQIGHRFRRYGFEVRIGIASTIGAAWAFARTGSNQTGGNASLLPLPIEMLRLNPSVLSKLHSVGISTIAELLRIPRASLPSRFGQELLTRLDQMFGRVPELTKVERPPEPVMASWAGEEPVSDRVGVLHVMRSLIESMANQLTERQLATQRLLARWHLVGAAPHEFSVNLLQPTASAEDLIELMELQLEGLWIQEPITTFRLEAVPSRHVVEQSGSLFGGGEASRAEARAAIASLVNRLSIKLGTKAVLRPILQADPQPELAIKLVPYIETTTATASSQIAHQEATASISLPRPLYFLPRPALVEVLALHPNGPPARFQWQREHHRVVHTWGPERIETGWWRERPIRRDYYRTETDRGRRFWLFRDRETARWYLQGVFT